MFFIGIVTGFFLFSLIQRFRLRSFHTLSSKIIKQAEREAKKRLDDALLKIEALDQEAHTRQWQLEKSASAIKTSQEKLEKERIKLQQKVSDIEKTERLLAKKRADLTLQEKNALETLEKIAACSSSEAKQIILKQFEDQMEQESASFLLERHSKDALKADQTALKLVIEAFGRLSKRTYNNYFTSEVCLPNEEIKAKIIGREGKNIKAFQSLSGVTLIIDETPLLVVLSSFDAERREIAKLALSLLIKEGQISPVKIEEALKKAIELLDKQLIEYGMEAASKAGVSKLHPELLKLLGKLKLRSSHGQNLLDHSVEVSAVMAMIAAELKLDASKAKRIGLLHDIGKVVSHQTALSHAKAGYEAALQWGESEDVALGIACHHKEIEPPTLEAALCQPADHLSASLLGARATNNEAFYRRLQQYEQIAGQFSGVESAFALEAGKELLVFVKPEMVSDEAAFMLAKNIASKIEEALPSSRKLQVTVIRQTQSVSSY